MARPRAVGARIPLRLRLLAARAVLKGLTQPVQGLALALNLVLQHLDLLDQVIDGLHQEVCEGREIQIKILRPEH